MYLINYDFYDLYALIVYFRSNPARFPCYIESIRQIIDYLNASTITNEIIDNQIRRFISPYFDKQDEALSWVPVNNVYTANIFVIKKEAYYRILSSVFEEMIGSYNDEERLYLLCDATHNIPLLLADEENPKKIIKIMINDYRKQYNKLFLKDELRSC